MGDPVMTELNKHRETLLAQYNLHKNRYWALRRAAHANAVVVRCSESLGVAPPPLQSNDCIPAARVAAQVVLDLFHDVCARMTARLGDLGGTIRIGDGVERTLPAAPSDVELREWADLPL